MWDVVLPAAIGVGGSLLVWGLKLLVDGRGERLKPRVEWAAQVLDAKSHRRVDSIVSEEFDWKELHDLTDAIPEPGGRANIETKGQLSEAHSAVLRQLNHLYELRLAETERGNYFSSVMESHISSFERRLIRWSNGRGSAKRIYADVPTI